MITAEQARDLVEMRKNFVAAASSDVTQHPRMVQHALKRFADLKAQNPASSNYQFDFVHGIGRSLSGDGVHHVTGFLLDSSPPKDEIEPDRAGYFLEPGFQSPRKRKPEPGVEECYLFFGLSYSEQQENELMGLPAMVVGWEGMRRSTEIAVLYIHSLILMRRDLSHKFHSVNLRFLMGNYLIGALYGL